MLGRPPFSFYGRYTTKKKVPVENMSQPGDDFSENPVNIKIPLVCYKGVFISWCFVLLSRFFMLTGNTFITNVLYGEAVKVSLYAIPESTSCNCMLAITKKAQNLYPY